MAISQVDYQETALDHASPLQNRLIATRNLSEELARPLSPEDQVVQSMEDASPTKWHLAHVTWFFEEFVLTKHLDNYELCNPDYSYCFNSYYNAIGDRQPRPFRGLLTRPSHNDVMAYRAHVDEGLQQLFEANGGDLPGEIADLIELGINHEQQHQELLLTDALHLLSANPLRPAYLPADAKDTNRPSVANKPEWTAFEGGICKVGHDGSSFHYDNEAPRHDALLQSFEIANRCVTNREWLEFMDDGGYEKSAHWLADGWTTVQEQHWTAPEYWELRNGSWHQMTLKGLLPVDPDRPVCHVSYFEADAYARWAGVRLPTEFEWEIASKNQPLDRNNAASGTFRPQAANGTDLSQMFGDVWEWTASPYVGYPGYRPPPGAVGEYNGKFMCGQFVLRGSSCATAPDHTRPTYRNFFHPHQRWQFMGLRLARDATIPGA